MKIPAEQWVGTEDDARLALVDGHLLMHERGRTSVDIPLARIRRVEFDIGGQDAASLVVVPDTDRAEDVLSLRVGPGALGVATRLIGRLAQRIG
jgi:hypothetical protein